MDSVLLDCLCQASLGHYYPHFVAIGLQKVEELASMTMEDYPRLGVHKMEDRKRLFHLIEIIQSGSDQDRDERTPVQPGCVYLQPQTSRWATRRQLQFDAFDKDSSAFSLAEISYPQPKKSSAEPIVKVAPTGQRSPKMQAEEESTTSGPLCRGMRGFALGPRDSEVPMVHRVVHMSGYNYGVPQTSIRPSSAEGENPWKDTDKIRVCVRQRPLSLREERRGEVSVVTTEGHEAIIVYEKKEAVNLKEYILQHVFYFDEVFSEIMANQDVYEKTAQPLIQHVFNRGNATCFAYGQTGAGKTYTMIGTQKNPGLYALAARDIFQLLESTQPSKDHSVWISFYEIYCGQLYDLLNERKRLHAREDAKHVVQIVGLREIQVHSVDFLLEMITKGSKERITGATGVNSDSSRSHAIIQIQIKDGRNRKFGRMSFIDLAGSERAADAKEADKQTKMEGAEINQSLLALKECIRALDQEQAHTPFRQSKLTQVLKDSFIGNSKTCMIANVSPSHMATEHTLNTLRYADRVKEIKRGIKPAATCTNQSKATLCLSPKRVQNSPSVLGEKILAKKVKLGVQCSSISVKRTEATAKTKAVPSVFHPSNVPLSSTPKPTIRPNRLGHNALKKFENQDKAPLQGNPQHIKTDVETEFKVHFSQQRSQMQPVQAVQPVQKQIVLRHAVPFGEQTPRLRDKICQTTVELGNLPVQKQREEHLKHYHQQFQNPPISQQKLHYQPLVKILDLCKPQEVKVGHINTLLSHHEGLPLEDPDDSDFSEDSFSHASRQKKGNQEELVSKRLSFFLHQSTLGSEIRKSSGRGQLLSFNDSDSIEQNRGVSFDCTGSCGFSERKPQCGHQNFWCPEEDHTKILSNISNAPEKPYAQEELPNQLKKKSELLSKTDPSSNFIAEQEPHCSSSPWTGSQTGSMLSRDHYGEAVNNTSDSSSAVMAPLTVSQLQDNWSMQSTQDLLPHGSLKSISSPKNGSFEKALESQIDGVSIEKNLSAIVKKMHHYNESLQSQISQLDKDWCLESNDECKLPSSIGSSPSFIAHQGPCDRKSTKSANMEPSPKKIDFSINDSSLAISRSIDRISQSYDADTEETAANYQRCRASLGVFSKNSPGKENGQKEILRHSPSEFPDTQSGCNHPTSGKHNQPPELNIEGTGLSSLEDSFKSSPFKDNKLGHLKNKLVQCYLALQRNQEDEISLRNEKNSKNRTTLGGQLSQATGQSTREFGKVQQLLRQAHGKQLKEVSALCCQEEALLGGASSSDFPDYLRKLDEILLQKSKHIENLRAQLQPLLGLSHTELSSLSFALDHSKQNEGEHVCRL